MALRYSRCLLPLILAMGIVAAGQSQLAMTLSPPRTSVALLVQDDTNLTQVRETRPVVLAAGEISMTVAWPGAAIDATSIRIAGPEGVSVEAAEQGTSQSDSFTWTVRSEVAGPTELVLTYLTTGIEWTPAYRLLINEGLGEARLEGRVTLRNRCGQSFENASVKLVIGERFIQDLGTLPDFALNDDISVPLLAPTVVPMRPAYLLHDAKYGSGVHRVVTLVNSTDAGLGFGPLVAADARVYGVGANGPMPLGTKALPYTPVGERCEIDLGLVEDIATKRLVMKRERTDIEFDRLDKVDGYDERETVVMEVSNWSTKSVALQYVDTVPGVWDVQSDHEYEEKGTNELVFDIELEPGSTKSVEYRLIKRQGRRVRLGPVRPK